MNTTRQGCGMSPWDEARSVLNLLIGELDTLDARLLTAINEAAVRHDQQTVDRLKVFRAQVIGLITRCESLRNEARRYGAVPA